MHHFRALKWIIKWNLHYRKPKILCHRTKVVKMIQSCLLNPTGERQPFRNELTHSVNMPKRNYNKHAHKDTSEDKVGVQKFAVTLWNTSSRLDSSLGSDSLSAPPVRELQGSEDPPWGRSIYAVAPHRRTLEDMSALFSGRPVIMKGHVWQKKGEIKLSFGHFTLKSRS